MPAGSLIDSAVLRVAHRDDGQMDVPSLAVPFAGSLCPTPALTLRPGAIGEDRIDLRACGLTDAAELAGLTVTYTANLTAGGAGASAHVDGVVLELAYRPPAVRRAATATSAAFTGPENATVIGEQPAPLTADVTLGRAAASASVALTGYGQLPVPAGSAIDSAHLRIVHQDDGPMGPVTATASFPGGTCGLTTLVHHPGALGVDRVDLKACGLNDAAQLGALTATYTANLPAPTAATQVPTTTGAVTAFADPGNARAVDGAVAEADLGGGTSSASVTLSGYDQPALPSGSFVDSAVLRVAHRDDGDIGPITVDASFAGDTCTAQLLPASPGTIVQDTIDVRACGLDDPAALAGLTVTYTAALAAGGTAATALLDGVELDISYRAPASDRLDGVELELVFRPPTFTPLSGCVTEGPYPSAGCALVKVGPDLDPAARFAVAGTVYAPTAALDLSMAEVSSQVFTRGLIARTLRLGLTPTAANRRPTTGIPPEAVVFTAYPDGNVVPATAGPSVGFADPDRARAADGLSARAALDTATATSASLTLSGYAAPALPAGTVVDSAVLRVTHREDVDIGSVSVTVTFPGNTCGPGPLAALPVHPGGLAIEDQVDLTACGLTSADQLAGLGVTYTVSVAAPPVAPVVNADLDGLTLDVLSGPLLRARVVFDRGQATVRAWSSLP